MPNYQATLTINNMQLGLSCDNNQLQAIDFISKKTPAQKTRTGLVSDVVKQLKAYQSGSLKKFQIPIVFNIGTPFQQRVWRELLTIPYGQTRTYGDLAKKLKTSPRAVGGACKVNPLPIVVPCHRVVAQNDLGGYGGSNPKKINFKQWLIQHEQNHL